VADGRDPDAESRRTRADDPPSVRNFVSVGPRADRPLTCPFRVLIKMTRRDGFVAVDDLELHYSEWGDESAPPVVCVHGLSRVGRDFDPLARRLEDEYRVLCPDAPGRGLSEWADDPDERYSPEGLSEILVGFCDALDVEEMRWVGTSMGGSLGIGLAAGPLRERITHLVCNDVGPAPAEDDAAGAGIERIVEYLSNPPAFERFTELERYYRETYATYSDQTDEEWRRFALTSARRLEDGRFAPAYDPRVVEPLLTAELDVDPWELWESIGAPTFVLRGERSDVLSESTFEEMIERRPETESLVVDCGHAPALNTDDQIDPIREFLAR
jgi:pimeloyl-ACP methyl ester carboxylesterase